LIEFYEYRINNTIRRENEKCVRKKNATLIYVLIYVLISSSIFNDFL